MHILDFISDSQSNLKANFSTGSVAVKTSLSRIPQTTPAAGASRNVAHCEIELRIFAFAVL